MSHDHDHTHAVPNPRAILALATVLSLVFAGVEAGVGLWAGSLALVADAGHMLNVAAAMALDAVAACTVRWHEVSETRT